MLDGLDYDDSDSPAIGLVPRGVPWADVRDHIKIAHGPLLLEPDGAGEYRGVYWTGTDAVLVGELGPDPEQAVAEFRAFLQEHGET